MGVSPSFLPLPPPFRSPTLSPTDLLPVRPAPLLAERARLSRYCRRLPSPRRGQGRDDGTVRAHDPPEADLQGGCLEGRGLLGQALVMRCFNDTTLVPGLSFSQAAWLISFLESSFQSQIKPDARTTQPTLDRKSVV